MGLWDAVKAVIKGKFTAVQTYLKTQEREQINNLNLHLKQLAKKGQRTPESAEGERSSRAEIDEKERSRQLKDQ